MALRLRMKGGRQTNFPYAVARIQGKRSKLIPPSQYEKLVKMDVNEITRFLEESAYKAEIDELSSRFQGLDLLEAALTVNAERTNHSVRNTLAGEGGALVALFLQRHLIEDVKSVLRGKLAGASREEMLKELLLEDLDVYNIFQPLLADDVRTPDDVAVALERQGGVARDLASVLQSVPAGSPPSRYEDALDKAYFARLVHDARESGAKGSDLLLQFVRREVDAINLMNASRWVHSRQEGDFSPYVVPGGRHLSVSAVVQLSRSSDLAALGEALRDLPFYEAVREGLDRARETRRLATFQTAVWRWVMAEMDRLSHQNPLSIVPILAFLVRKQREVANLRTLARGRAAGLSEERLMELVQ